MASAPVYTMPMLEGKVTIVTGASSGIGLAVATALLGSGANVLGVDMSPSPSTLSSHAKFAFHQCNLTASSSHTDIVKACVEKFGGRIDVLMNVAGVMDLNHSADTLEDEMWDRVIAVNLTAPVKLMREVLAVMKAQGSGSIVNVCSKAGLSGASAGVAYTASKHGLVGATKNVAWRFKDDAIRCNAICPGGVRTNIHTTVDLTKFDMEATMKLKPITDAHIPYKDGQPQLAAPEDMVGILLFLASDMSKKMSGAIIPVDNAWSAI